MDDQRFQMIKCVNPFNKLKHLVRDKKKLQNVTDWMHQYVPNMPQNSKICGNCRKEITQLKNQKEKEEVPSDSDTDPTFSAPTSQSKTQSSDEILCKVDPTTPTGRIYRLSDKDVERSNEALKRAKTNA